MNARTIDPKVFLRAAQVVEKDGHAGGVFDYNRQTFSCLAIDEESNFGMSFSLERKFYESLFDMSANCMTIWRAETNAKRKHLRVMLLCLAACVAESEGA